MSIPTKVAVYGSSEFDNYKLLSSKIDKYTVRLKDIELVLGFEMFGNPGVYHLAHQWGLANWYTRRVFYPYFNFWDKRKWRKMGSEERKGIEERNEDMVKYAQCAIVFDDGIQWSTKDFIRRARKHRLQLRIVKFD